VCMGRALRTPLKLCTCLAETDARRPPTPAGGGRGPGV